MIKLTHKQTLEFYDVPHLFVATDVMGVNYLCVLYDQEEDYKYLAVRISQVRLDAYLAGQVDLRLAYTQPEQEYSLFKVIVENKSITATAILDVNELREDMLPLAGFYHDVQGAIDDNTTDTIKLSIPKSDSNFLAEIVHRMGWNTSSLSSSIRKIAVL